MNNKLLVLAFVALAFAGCAKKENSGQDEEKQQEKSYIRVKSKKYGYDIKSCEVPCEASADTINIFSNDTWHVNVSESGAGWIYPSDSTGTGSGRLILNISQNTYGTERQATVCLYTDGADSLSFSVIQGAGGSVVSCNYPYDMVFMHGGNEYAHGEWTEDRLLKYLVTTDNQWYFDGFAWCCSYFGQGDGKKYFDVTVTDARTKQSDWETLLDYYITKTFKALDEATRQAIELVGTERTTKVIVAIPWPSHGQSGWGTIDGETISFTDNDEKVKAVKWWIDLVIKKWHKAYYKNLELVGFYWLHEALGMNTTEQINVNTITQVAAYIHSYNTEFYWCPYFDIDKYSDARIDKWKSYGFDRVTYQPNYYFYNVPVSRLETTCTRAHAANIGLEFELDWKALNYSENLAKAKEYIEAFDEYGVWDNDIMSYYHGYRAFEDIASSKTQKYIEFNEMLSSRVAKRQKRFYGW